jgi:hypothetical protein
MFVRGVTPTQEYVIRRQRNQYNLLTISKGDRSSPGHWADITGFEKIIRLQSGQVVLHSVMNRNSKGRRSVWATVDDHYTRQSPTVSSRHVTVSATWVLGTSAKLRHATISFVMCLQFRSHVTNRPKKDGFSWILRLQYFSKICHKNSSCMKIRI